MLKKSLLPLALIFCVAPAFAAGPEKQPVKFDLDVEAKDCVVWLEIDSDTVVVKDAGFACDGGDVQTITLTHKKPFYNIVETGISRVMRNRGLALVGVSQVRNLQNFHYAKAIEK